MLRIFCNGCYSFYNKEKLFSLTSCGHVYCNTCLPHGARAVCNMCKRKVNHRVIISKSMPEPTQMLFKDMRKTVASVHKVVRFQNDQNDQLMQHLLKENERLKRLCSCFKKRVDYLLKHIVSVDVSRQMYTTIKQEPVDNYTSSEYFTAAQLNEDANGEMKTDGIKNDQLDGVDWTENMEMSDQQAIQKSILNNHLMSRYNSYPVQMTHKDTELPAEMKAFGIDINQNNGLSAMQNQQLNYQDPTCWYSKPLSRLSLNPGVEKISNMPTRQATIDQFLNRGNNHINTANHISLINQSIGTGNYPNTVLSTRPIDAKTINNPFVSLQS